MQSRNVFHAGEAAVQLQANAPARLPEMAAKFIRDRMPDQHRLFFQERRSLYLGLLDDQGRVWAVPVFGPEGFVSSPDDTTLNLSELPAITAELNLQLSSGSKIGVLGLEARTRRRNRMNGIITSGGSDGISIHVEQSFGNCPQYIQARDFAWDLAEAGNRTSEQKSVLDPDVKRIIELADTFFIASRTSSLTDDPRDGLDASHRGGRPGFVSVNADGLVSFPDFSGNRFFNTLGNIENDGRVGLYFPDFKTRSGVFLTGRATIDWSSSRVKNFEGAERIVDVQPEEVWLVKNAIPGHGDMLEAWPRLNRTGIWS